MTVEPITVHYVSSDEDWHVTVTGRGQEVTGQAPGIIAARDRADQLIEKIAPEEEGRTAVHLLNGDALEFTTAYINARLGRTDSAELASASEAAGNPASAEQPAASEAGDADEHAEAGEAAEASEAEATEQAKSGAGEAAEAASEAAVPDQAVPGQTGAENVAAETEQEATPQARA